MKNEVLESFDLSDKIFSDLIVLVHFVAKEYKIPLKFASDIVFSCMCKVDQNYHDPIVFPFGGDVSE